jgi:hypothetical protein
MIKPSRRKQVDLNLAYDLASEIESANARQACEYLIKYSEGLSGWECGATRKGYLNDFRFYSPTEWPFAFIINKGSLLWYFRPAGLRHEAANVVRLRKEFDFVEELRDGHIKVRISDLADARRIVILVFGRTSP